MKKKQIFDILKEIKDPEIPVIDIVEMGIIRDVDLGEENLEVTITPTYSGCPAMEVIQREILDVLHDKGFDDVSIKTAYAPAWTTDWMTDDARQKLKEYGIAPPEKVPLKKEALFSNLSKKIACPYCDSCNTEQKSEFGSTACISLFYCNECLEPFEHFKCI